MVQGLHSIATHIYGAAAIVYLVFLIRQRAPLAIVGRILVGAGVLAHGFAVGMLILNQGGKPIGIAQAFSTLALLLAVIFLFLDLRYRLPILGAFVVPMTLAILVPGLLLEGDLGTLPAELRRPLLPVHVTVAVAGIAAFGVACAIALVYLLMDRQMKAKRFGLLFSRLPPLQVLDDLNRHLVIWGFIALSITVVTGAFFVSRTDAAFFWAWEPKEVATLVAWLVFGVLLNARLFAGWNGRRVAVLTMAGFGILLVSFLTAFNPAASGIH